MTEIVNRVEKSGLISLDLEEILGDIEVVTYDLSQNLFEGLILKEKDFRKDIKEHDWSMYAGKNVAVTCSADAIVPIWAYMLVVSKLEPSVLSLVVGSEEDLLHKLVDAALGRINVEEYEMAKVVVKGCSDKKIPLYAYGELMKLLMPVASSIMFGEPCSTVPLYKRRMSVK